MKIKYVLQESFRMLVQMVFGLRMFTMPGLKTIRETAYRVAFRIGKNPNIGEGTNFHREHQMVNGKLSIGENVLLARNTDIDYCGEVIIGNNVWISENAIIFSHYHELVEDRTQNVKEHVFPTKLVIREYAWVGAHAMILPRVTFIGKHAIVGAGAVVTKNVPDYAVVVGNPAVVIKYLNFNAEDKNPVSYNAFHPDSNGQA